MRQEKDFVEDVYRVKGQEKVTIFSPKEVKRRLNNFIGGLPRETEVQYG